MLGHLKTAARMTVGIPIAFLLVAMGIVNHAVGRPLGWLGVEFGNGRTGAGSEQFRRAKEWVTP